MSPVDNPSGPREQDENAATRRYLELVRALHSEWDELEARGETGVQLSHRARASLTESVRADVRHGAQVQMPPTSLGPFTLSELSLRTLVRTTVDRVPGAISLKTSFNHATVPDWLTRGTPQRIFCRISASAAAPDLPALANRVRTSVQTACAQDLDLTDVVVDIHIEDLYDS